jgi:hypothetical protein
MPPGRSDWMSAIRRPRFETSRMPTSAGMAPLATAAVYSPRLWPATKSAPMPASRASSSIPIETEKSAGCAASVAVSSSIGPSRQSLRIGSPDASSACSR